MLVYSTWTTPFTSDLHILTGDDSSGLVWTHANQNISEVWHKKVWYVMYRWQVINRGNEMITEGWHISQKQVISGIQFHDPDVYSAMC